MSVYGLGDGRRKSQELEDRKIDRRYHWFIFLFVVFLVFAVVVLVLSYFSGVSGFGGFNGVVRGFVWSGFTALFVFWALLVSIIRVREAYYEAADYRAFARLSVVQFFYVWAGLLVLVFVLVCVVVGLLFPGGSGGGFGVSPFFVFYLLAFFSYCYLVFMLSFGYVRDLEVFESGGDGVLERLGGVEVGLRRVLERLDGVSGGDGRVQSPVSGSVVPVGVGGQRRGGGSLFAGRAGGDGRGVQSPVSGSRGGSLSSGGVRGSYYGGGGVPVDGGVGGGVPSRVSQEWLASSLDSLSLPRPVPGGVGGGVPVDGGAGQGSWEELFNQNNATRTRRRIR